MTSCKPSSGFPCPAAHPPAASQAPQSLLSGAGRRLLVAASGGTSGSTTRLQHRQAWQSRRRRARSNARLCGAAAGGSASGRQTSTASADDAAGIAQDSSRGGSRSSGRAINGGSGSSSSSSSSRPGSGRGERRREPCIPPLPFWVAGVSVVGLPDDQLIFSFLTPSEAAAAARRQLRPELPYGPSALKLATLQGDRVQAILDRWQYAIAQRELASLDARPMLWWRYDSALKSAAGGNGSGLEDRGRGRGSGSCSSDDESAAPEPEGASFSRRQMRRMARAAKAAARTARRTSQAAPACSRAASGGSAARCRQDADADHSRGSPAQQAPVGLVVNEGAFQPSWQVCTLRGLPDGTVIYKFSDDFEPVLVGQELGGGANGAAAGAAAAAAGASGAAAGAAAGGPGDAAGEVVLGTPAIGFTSQSPPAGEAGTSWRQEQRPKLGKLLLLQEQQPCLEGVPWSSALRLGVRFSNHARSVLNKLQTFTTEFEQRQSSSIMLSSRLHPSYEKALARVQRARLAEEVEDQAQQPQQAQQAQQAHRAQRERERQQDSSRLHTEQDGGASHLVAQREEGQQQRMQQREQQQEQKREQQPPPPQQQQWAAAPQVQPDSQATPTSSSSGSSSAAAGKAGSQKEAEWQAELLLRPQWHPPPAELLASPGAAETKDKVVQAVTGRASPAARRRAQRQQPQAQQPAAPWAQLLALAAALRVAALRQLRSVLVGILGFCLALYRLLPVLVRRLFWRSWPPQWPGHLSPAVRQLLHARRLGEAELLAAGFNAEGHSAEPLADLQAWQVERLTGCRVRDLSLYRAALTHKSALPQELRVAQSYERLEFLGDAVLSLACRTLLMERCPTSDEGEMTKLSSLLVSGASNARYAAFLGLEHYLVLDPRILREGGQHTPHILADVFEALLGALYLDAGWAAAHAFCRRVLGACVDWSQVEADAEDWKGVFSRLASQQRRPQPQYRTTSTRKRQFRGGLQLKWYTVDVQYAGEVVGTGSGWERRWAEQAAARQALGNMGQLPGQEAVDAAAE